jgi:hypothetical protein
VTSRAAAGRRRPAARVTQALALALMLALPATLARAQSDTSWVTTERAARAALAAGDTLSFRNELLRLCDQLNDNPRVMLRLARAEASLGHRGSACHWLARYADMGLGFDLSSDALLAAAARDSECSRTRVRLNQNLHDPVDHAGVVFALPDSGTLAEDVTYDPRSRRYFVSSVKKGRVLSFDRHGHPLRYVGPEQDQLWSVMAVSADPIRGRLWVTTACLREGARWAKRDSGRTAVLCYGLAKGRRLGRWEPPHDGNARVLGDMTVGPDGSAYVSESLRGAVYVIHGPSGSLETLVPEGTFRSPQTPALTPDRTRLLIPDYVLGIAIVDLSTRKVTWLGHRRDVALTGIDGLYVSGHALIAIQNGTQPERVLRAELDDGMTRVESSRVLQQNTPGLGDPTHGVLVGPDFQFIANSGWDRVDDSNPAGRLTPGAPPRIMRIHLSEGP